MLRYLAAALTVAALLTSCGGGDSEPSAENDDPEPSSEAASLEDPYDTCANLLESDLDDQFGDTAPPLDEIFGLEDDDTRIVISPPDGDVVQPYIYEGVECLLVGLDAPGSVKDAVLRTPATDGPQTETWDDVTIEYDIPGPDFAGLEATIQRTG